MKKESNKEKFLWLICPFNLFKTKNLSCLRIVVYMVSYNENGIPTLCILVIELIKEIITSHPSVDSNIPTIGKCMKYISVSPKFIRLELKWSRNTQSGASCYLKKKDEEEGLCDLQVNYISPQHRCPNSSFNEIGKWFCQGDDEH